MTKAEKNLKQTKQSEKMQNNISQIQASNRSYSQV